MRTQFLEVAHRAPADPAGLADYLDSGLAPIWLEFPAAVAGIVTALLDRFPDMGLWIDAGVDWTHNASGFLQALVPEHTSWNDVYLARWAVSGSLVPLGELVRRSIHRDGSRTATSVGSDAMALLIEAAAADPVLRAELAANNVSLGRVRFGVFLEGAFSLPMPLVASGRPAPAPAPPLPVQIASFTAHAARPSSAYAQPAGPSPDFASGTVTVDDRVLSITAATKVRDGLTRAITALLRPDEGFVWVDDTADPQARAVLLDFDGSRCAGLSESGGGYVRADVTQVPSRGPDPNSGKYAARVYSAAGSVEFMTGVDDMNAAKFQVAERVRQAL